MNSAANRYKETFTTWNKVAKLYEDKFMHLDLYNDSYATFCEFIANENSSILEIGCGPGNITKYLLSQNPNYDILGIDIAPKMIELAEKNNPSANFKIMDSRDIDSINTTFDAIICGFCLPYLSKTDRQKLVKDSCQLLSDNGIIYISFVEGNYEKSGFQTGSSNNDRVYFYYHELTDLKSDLIENNFKIVRIINTEYKKQDGIEIHTIVIAKK